MALVVLSLHLIRPADELNFHNSRGHAVCFAVGGWVKDDAKHLHFPIKWKSGGLEPIDAFPGFFELLRSRITLLGEFPFPKQRFLGLLGFSRAQYEKMTASAWFMIPPCCKIIQRGEVVCFLRLPRLLNHR